MGWGWNVGLMSPSKEWSQLRSYIQQAVGPQMVPRYREVISGEITQLLKRLVDFEGDPSPPLKM
jgi:hypothetical protein